jgi:hypothetical protein
MEKARPILLPVSYPRDPFYPPAKARKFSVCRATRKPFTQGVPLDEGTRRKGGRPLNESRGFRACVSPIARIQ